jgi:hypothetical protein
VTPSYDELLSGATRWRHEHKGVGYLLSFHGYRRGDEYQGAEHHPGTWCYYLLIPEQMYPHRWQDFAVTRNDRGYCDHGPAFDHDMFDSEITCASSEPYWDRKTERMWDASKVGCDYNHLWHSERGYPDNYSSVRADAERTVEKFLDRNPDHLLRCEYSGLWGAESDFYTARNGRRVHNSKRGEFSEEHWATWLPATEAVDV